MKRTPLGLIVLGLVLVCAPPLHASPKPGLVGTWEVPDGGYMLVLTLAAGGSGTFDGDPITYSVKGDHLVIDDDGETLNYGFSLAGDRLTLSGGDLDGTMVFSRHGASAARGAPPSGQMVPPGGDPAAAKARSGPPDPAGTWQFQNPGGVLTLILNPDHTGSLNGSPGRWQLAGGRLTLAGQDGAMMIYQAELTETTLALTGGNLPMPITLQRTAYPGQQGGFGMDQQGGGGAAIMQQLVGTWCYFSSFQANNGGGSSTQECYTLNADGTYTRGGESGASAYTGDSYGNQDGYGATSSQLNGGGTWSATETTLTIDGQTTAYERRNNQNGDPMICVDGRCYATATQRAAW